MLEETIAIHLPYMKSYELRLAIVVVSHGSTVGVEKVRALPEDQLVPMAVAKATKMWYGGGCSECLPSRELTYPLQRHF